MNTDLESVKLYRDVDVVSKMLIIPLPLGFAIFSLPLGFHLLLPGNQEEKGQIEKNNSMVEFLVYVKKVQGEARIFRGRQL